MTGFGREDGPRGPGDADHDGDPYADLPPIDGLVIPDDASELEADLVAWRREAAQQAREQLRVRRRARRAGSRSRLRRLGLSLPMGVSVAVAVLLVVLFTTVFAPTRAPLAPAVPLATGVAATGAVGALLPDVTLTAGSGVAVPARLLRPATLVLVPDPCTSACGAIAAEVVAQSRSLQVRAAVVLPMSATDATGSLSQAAASATLLADDTDLRQVVQATGVTAIIVGADGKVVDIARSITDGERLESRIRPISPAA